MFEQAFKNIDDVLWKDQTGLGLAIIHPPVPPRARGMSLDRKHASLDEYFQ